MPHVLELNYCPRCGHSLEDRFVFGRTRRFCPACQLILFREHKVAAGVIVEWEGKVLLIRRAINPRKGLWTFPAGFVEHDEDPADAAVRECQEETGLKVKVTGLLDVIAGREHPRGADLVIVYRGRAIGGELSTTDEVDDIGFFAPDELPPLAFQATQEALERWQSSDREA